MNDKANDGNLHIWKLSHGKDFTQSQREALRKRSVITLHRDTRKGQNTEFRNNMCVGDFFYLTHGNDVQLFGQISSAVKRPRAEWIEREYITIRALQCRSGRFTGSPRWWAPNANTTCERVKEQHLRLFEKQVLFHFFRLRLRDLEQLRSAFIQPEELAGSVPAFGGKYEEASKRRLMRHEALETVTVRNRKLVSDAKSAFKHRHGKLFCEVCDFDFYARYRKRGEAYIEAHHLVPIAQLSAATQLMIKDLAMVCANCHRMLHRPPWISVKKLRKSL